MHDERDQIEAEMRAVRARLNQARGQVQAAGRRWRDWRTHVRAHPAMIGLAVGVAGYLLVPRRAGVIRVASTAVQATTAGSPVGRLLAAGLRLGLQHGLPLLVGLAAERLQRANQQAPTDEVDEVREPFAPRRPR